MGQAYSYKDVSTAAPGHVMAEPQGATHFACVRNAPSSKNYNVHRDNVNGHLWLFVRKTGHTLQKKEATKLILENFNKEVLCMARLEPRSDNSFSPTYSFRNLVKYDGGEQIRPGRTKHETIRTTACLEQQWKCQTKAVIYRSHSLTEYMAEIYVEAAGSVIRETQKIKGRDSENFPSVRTVFKDAKQVDSVRYAIHLVGGQDICFTPDEPNCAAPQWDCAMFSASVTPRDDWKRTWDIKVKDGFDPSLSLLIALVCSSILTPAKIVHYLPVKWP